MSSTGIVPHQDPMFGAPELSPLPTQDTPTPAYIPPNVDQQGSGPGWMGTGGKVADVAAQFLHGWMQGKAVKEERDRKQATNKVSAAWAAYNTAMQVANNENLPPASRQAAAAQLAPLKDIYIDQIRAYSAGNKGGKGGAKGSAPKAQSLSPAPNSPVPGGMMPNDIMMEGMRIPLIVGPQGGPSGAVGAGGGAPGPAGTPTPAAAPANAPQDQTEHHGKVHNVMAHVASAFMAKKPEMFAEGMADLLSGALPTSPTNPNPLRQPAIQTAQAHATEAQNQATLGGQQVDVNNMNIEQQRGVMSLHRDADALSKKINQEPEGSPERKVDETDLLGMKAQLAGHGIKIFTPGEMATQEGQEQFTRQVTNIKNQALQKVASGQPVGFFESQMLGTNPKDLMEVYLQNVGPDKRFATNADAVHQMQVDQAEIYKSMYGFRSPWMQAEQQVKAAHPDWTDQQVAEGVITYMRGTTGQKNDMTGTVTNMNPQQAQQLAQQAFQQVVTQDPSLAPFFRTVQNGKYLYGPQPSPEHWYTRDSTKAANVEAQQRGMQMAREALKSRGYSDEIIQRVLGGAGQGGVGLEAPPSGVPGQSPVQRYKVTDVNGRSAEREMTSDLAAQAAQNGMTVVLLGGAKQQQQPQRQGGKK